MASYVVLGIAPDATDDQVRLAYKHKALQCHPDRHTKDKDVATRNFIELNTAYRAILRQRARMAAASSSDNPPEKPAEQQKQAPPREPTPSKPPCSSASSTPSSTPSSSPFTTPSSSPYSTPASTPASSTTSLPEEGPPSSSTKKSASCEDIGDEEDDRSTTAGSFTTSHTAKPPDSLYSSASPKASRAKLRKQQPKPKFSTSSSSNSSSSHDCKYHDSRSKPTYTTSTKSDDMASHNTLSDTHSHSSKHSAKLPVIELKEYYSSLPSLKDYPRVDLASEWFYPLPLALEDLFHGKRLCYRIKRRYLSGKTKNVVLDVDVPAGCRAGTKIVFRDAGHERRDETKQDLVFVVREMKHERFVRGCDWDGGGKHGHAKKDEENSKERPKEGRDRDKDKDKDKDRDRDKDSVSAEAKRRKSRKYREDDLVMEVRLPWVDRLKEEKAKVVVSGVDGKEIVFEVDCRSGKGGDKDKETKKEKMTDEYIVEDAGMPVRIDIRGAGSEKDDDAGPGVPGERGRLIIRHVYVSFNPVGGVDREPAQVGDICPSFVFLVQVGNL